MHNHTLSRIILQFPAGNVDAADVVDNNARVTRIVIMTKEDSRIRVITVKICREGKISEISCDIPF